MKKIIKKIKSPFFENEKRNILILEPKNLTKITPVLFFFDGQILKLDEREFNQDDGIDILNLLKNLGKFVIIAVNSMNYNSFFKYRKRIKELMNRNQKGTYLFFDKIKQEILKLQKKYTGIWFGFGFSLSSLLLGKHKAIFDYSILVSPYFGKDNFKLPKNSIVFYGKKEYKTFSNKKINNPIKRIKILNSNINFVEIQNMKHTFRSWNEHFGFILKKSVKPFLHS